MPLILISILKEWKLILCLLLAFGVFFLWKRGDHYQQKAEELQGQVTELQAYKDSAIASNAVSVEREQIRELISSTYKKIAKGINNIPKETKNAKGCEYLDIAVDPDLDRMLSVRPETRSTKATDSGSSTGR